MINSVCSRGLWLGSMKNSDWPLGWQNGIRPFIEITLKKQLSKSTLVSLIQTNLYLRFYHWGRSGSKVTTGRKTRDILLVSYNSGTFPIKGCFFDIVANTFNWDVTLWIYMFWSLILITWSDSGWFRNVRIGSGCFFTLWHKVWSSLSGF